MGAATRPLVLSFEIGRSLARCHRTRHGSLLGAETTLLPRDFPALLYSHVFQARPSSDAIPNKVARQLDIRSRAGAGWESRALRTIHVFCTCYPSPMFQTTVRAPKRLVDGFAAILTIGQRIKL